MEHYGEEALKNSMLEEFEPANQMERVILEAKAGRLPMKVLAGMLLGSEILLPSASEVRPDLSGFQPLLFERNGESLVAAFTSTPLMLPYRKSAQYFAELLGLQALRRMPPEFGLMLNANSPVALEITAEGLRQMVRDFA